VCVCERERERVRGREGGSLAIYTRTIESANHISQNSV
jgi:hypothetical protein